MVISREEQEKRLREAQAQALEAMRARKEMDAATENFPDEPGIYVDPPSPLKWLRDQAYDAVGAVADKASDAIFDDSNYVEGELGPKAKSRQKLVEEQEQKLAVADQANIAAEDAAIKADIWEEATPLQTAAIAVNEITSPATRGTAKLLNILPKATGAAIRAGGYAAGSQSLSDYGKQIGENAAAFDKAVDEIIPATELEQKSFSDMTMREKVGKVGQTVGAFIPDVVGMEIAGPTAFFAAKGIPEEIDAAEKTTGKYGAEEILTGAGQGSLSAMVFGKLMSQAQGAASQELASMARNMLGKGALQKVGVAVDAFLKELPKEVLGFGMASGGLEGVRVIAEKSLKREAPELNKQDRERILGAVVESIPTAIAAKTLGVATRAKQAGDLLTEAKSRVEAQRLSEGADAADMTQNDSVAEQMQAISLPDVVKNVVDIQNSRPKEKQVLQKNHGLEVVKQGLAAGAVENPKAFEYRIGDVVLREQGDGTFQVSKESPKTFTNAKIEEMDAISRLAKRGNVPTSVSANPYLETMKQAGNRREEADISGLEISANTWANIAKEQGLQDGVNDTKSFQHNGATYFAVPIDPTNPEAGVTLSRGTPRSEKMLETMSAIQGPVTEKVEAARQKGLISDKDAEMINTLYASRPDLNENTIAHITDQIYGVGTDIAGSLSVMRGRVSNPNSDLGRKALMYIANDGSGISANAVMHETAHTAWDRMSDGMKAAFKGWAKNAGIEGDAKEIHANLFETWAGERLNTGIDVLGTKVKPPEFVARLWQDAKDGLSNVLNGFRGIATSKEMRDKIEQLGGNANVLDNRAKAALDEVIRGGATQDMARQKTMQPEASNEVAVVGNEIKTVVPTTSTKESADVGAEFAVARSEGIEAPVDASMISRPSGVSVIAPRPDYSYRTAGNVDKALLNLMAKRNMPPKEQERILGLIEEHKNFISVLDSLGKSFPEGIASRFPVAKGAGGVRNNAAPQYVRSVDFVTTCIRDLGLMAIGKDVMQESIRSGGTASEGLLTAVTLMRASGILSPCDICYKMNAQIMASDGVAEAVANWEKLPSIAELTAMTKTERSKLPSAYVTVAFLKEQGIGKDMVDPLYKMNTKESLKAKDNSKEYSRKVKVMNSDGVIKEKTVMSALAGMFGPARQAEGYSEYAGWLLQNGTVQLPTETGTKPVSRQQFIDWVKDFGGFRFNSNSEFQPEHAVDYWQALMHLDALGGTAHAYTNLPDYVMGFSKTGLKHNMSVYMDSVNGQIVNRKGQGMPLEAAMKLQRDFDNAGAVVVATNRDILKWAMDNPDIKYVLPSHLNKKQQKAFGAPLEIEDFGYGMEKFKEGKSFETLPEKYKSFCYLDEVTGKHKMRIPMSSFCDFKNGDTLQSMEKKYKQICDEMGVTYRFQDLPEVFNHPQYMKCVVDFARWDTPQNKIDISKADNDYIGKTVMNKLTNEQFTGHDGERQLNSNDKENILKFIREHAGSGKMVETANRQRMESLITAGKNLSAPKKARSVAVKEIMPAAEVGVSRSSRPLIPEAENIMKKVNRDGTQQRKYTWDRFYAGLVDDLDPIRKAVAQMTGGAELPFDQSPYELARLTRGSVAKADAYINYKPFDPVTLKFRKDKGLKEILQPIGDNIDEFTSYLVAKRSEELGQRNIKSGFSAPDTSAVIQKYDPIYKQAADELYRYQNDLLIYGVRTGLFTPQDYANIRKSNKAYVPFYRILDDADMGGMSGGDPRTFEVKQKLLRMIEGSDRDIGDPLENIVRNTYTIITAADRNQVLQRLSEIADRTPNNGIMEKATKPEYGNVSVIKNGKREYYVIDEDLAGAVKAMDRESTNVVTKILAAPARFLREGATLAPEFALRNPVRDQFSATLYSKYGFIPAYDLMRGMWKILNPTKDKKNEELYWKWQAAGGGNAIAATMDRDYLQDTLDGIVAKNGGWASVKNVITSPSKMIDALTAPFRAFGSVTEQGTRMGEFARGYEQSGGDPQKIREAALSSRDVTMDFSKQGNQAREWNKITAFFSANINGQDRAIKQFSDPKTAPKAWLTALATLTAPTIGLMLQNLQDPRYKMLPEWQRRTFWMLPVPGRDRPDAATWSRMSEEEKIKSADEAWIRFPKPQGLLLTFTMVPEMIMEAAQENDPKIIMNYAKDYAQNQLPPVLPTIATPLAERFANKSMLTGNQIVPPAMEKAMPEDQYNLGTTETMKAIARKAGKYGVGFSPAMVENDIKTLTGGMGQYALKGVDYIARNAGMVKDPMAGRPDPTVTDYPGVKGFAARPLSTAAQPIQDFNAAYQQALALHTSANLDKVDDSVADEDKRALPEWKTMEKFQERMSKIRKAMKLIQDSSDMTKEEKTQDLKALTMSLIDTANEGLEFWNSRDK